MQNGRSELIIIYFVEDDDNIRKLVCYALRREGYEISGFAAPHELWQALHAESPELLLLDIMLPEEDGLTLLRRLRSDPRWAELPIIMLTAKGSEFDRVTGLDAGADDYIAKPFGMTELVSRVRAVLRRTGRGRGRSSGPWSVGELYVDPERHIVEISGEPITLSYKEFSLLTVLLEAEGTVLTREELLSKVWGEFYGESRTLDVHIRKLRVKLGTAGEYIRTVKNIGYKLCE